MLSRDNNESLLLGDTAGSEIRSVKHWPVPRVYLVSAYGYLSRLPDEGVEEEQDAREDQRECRQDIGLLRNDLPRYRNTKRTKQSFLVYLYLVLAAIEFVF